MVGGIGVSHLRNPLGYRIRTRSTLLLEPHVCASEMEARYGQIINCGVN